MMSPVSRCIVVKRILLEPLLKHLVGITIPAFKFAEREISYASHRDVGVSTRKPVLPGALKILLRCIVNQANDAAFCVDRN